MGSNLDLKPPPDELVTPLLELRDYCVQQLEEYERLYNKARSQLDHVEALLSNWTNKSNTVDKPVTLEIADEVFTPGVQENSTLSPSDSISEDYLDLIENQEDEVDEVDDLEIDNQHQAPSVNSELPALITETLEESQENSVLWLEVPMLAQYQKLTRMEAIEQLLKEHAGTILHIDDIVEALYGKLKPNVFKVVKGRVQSSLTYGRKSQTWSLIEDQPGHFTFDVKLLPHNLARNDHPQRQPRRRSSVPPQPKEVPMREEFQGQFLIDALTAFLEQNAGKVFNVAEVTNAIYGELSVDDLREVKNKLLNELSRGHRIGRFSRVPNQIGVYTWDEKLIGK